MTNKNNNGEKLNYLHCYTYSHSKISTHGAAYGSIFSIFPISLDKYNTVTINYRTLNKTEEQGSQCLCFGFTKEIYSSWFSCMTYKSISNNWNSTLTSGYTKDYTTQIDITHLNGYGYFAISFLNSCNNLCLIADIYNIKFE